MVILEPQLFSLGNVSKLRVVLDVKLNGLYSPLSPVVHGDISQSINTNTKIVAQITTQNGSPM